MPVAAFSGLRPARLSIRVRRLKVQEGQVERPASHEGAPLQRKSRLERGTRRLSPAVAALLVVAAAGGYSTAARAPAAGGSASGAEPDAVVALGGMAQAPGAPTRPASTQDDQRGEGLLDPSLQVDYEELARALEAIYSTKPTCAMRIIEADPVDEAMARPIERPVDAAMVRESNCR